MSTEIFLYTMSTYLKSIEISKGKGGVGYDMDQLAEFAKNCGHFVFAILTNFCSKSSLADSKIGFSTLKL